MAKVSNSFDRRLEEQLELYLKNINTRISIKDKTKEKDITTIKDFIQRTNDIADIMTSEKHRALLAMEREQIGPVFLRVIKCVDGRDENAIDGENIKVWRIPAALIQVRKRADGTLIPEAHQLVQGIRAAALDPDTELLQLIRPHTSTHTSHGCGAMKIKKDNGEVNDTDLAMANLRLIQESSMPAVTTLYNDQRRTRGMEPLKEVSVPLVFDTDDMGVILNYEGREKGKSIESSKLTLEYKELIEKVVGDKAVYASMREKYTEPKNYHDFIKRIYFIVEAIFHEKKLRSLRDILTQGIDTYCPELSAHQKHALMYYIARRIAFQQLTGLASESSHPHHAHAHHNEDALIVSRFSKYPGQFDPGKQMFTVSPENMRLANQYITVVLGIMDHTRPGDKRIVYLAYPIKEAEAHEQFESYRYAAAFNAQMFTSIIDDSVLGKKFRNGELILISMLIDEDSRKVLKILDPSIYI